MKISYSWLRQYLPTDLPAKEIAQLLTNMGLEVESTEQVQSVKGGLEGLVIGRVTTCAKHPNADKLSLTTVDTGAETDIHVVCGAPNVAAGQKVVVATVGTTVYPTEGEPFKINKSKIRGEISEGMICAEDEIGLGTSHNGIMVLPDDAPIGVTAKEYFRLEDDHVFEIGLTPNRADAASHIGVARDLAAVLNSPIVNHELSINYPSIENFKVVNQLLPITIEVEDKEACPRYSGICISNIKVAPSPDWLQNRLRAIGVRPINNIVDITNFVCHELGQPLHAFDYDKINGSKVVVKKLAEGSTFTTLDEVKRTLSADDLMICDAKEGMCIAGVFGGTHSGVTENTTHIFIESAYFNPVGIRKTSKRHGLKTDASFRFERGADPEVTVYALKRAALLIREIAGGTISSEVVDVYPHKIEPAQVDITYAAIADLIGKEIPSATIKTILAGLNIRILHESAKGLKLQVPSYKVDVTGEEDIVEEVLRIYGYNNVEIPSKLNASLSFSPKPDNEAIQNAIADFLSANGFNEIMSNSLTKSAYLEEGKTISSGQSVVVLNPLSNDLDILRQTMLFSGLEAILYNLNRKATDLKFYEFGKTYHAIGDAYLENRHLALFITGKKQPEQWNANRRDADFYFLKSFAEAILKKLNTGEAKVGNLSNELIVQGLNYTVGGKTYLEMGMVAPGILKKFDLNQPVFVADFNWDLLLKKYSKNKIAYSEVPKFPAVRRDLSMLLDNSVTFANLKNIAFQTEKALLKEVNIFDVYQGDRLPQGKKSYALSFILQDEGKTLTDKQIDGVMERLVKSFEEKAGAEVRKQ